MSIVLLFCSGFQNIVVSSRWRGGMRESTFFFFFFFFFFCGGGGGQKGSHVDKQLPIRYVRRDDFAVHKQLAILYVPRDDFSQSSVALWLFLRPPSEHRALNARSGGTYLKTKKLSDLSSVHNRSAWRI